MALCSVDAGGVPAEWVEATVATTDQPTILYFHAADHLEDGRNRAVNLALTTRARVLSVGCSPGSVAVADGLMAYAWLLGEGVDLERTAFFDDHWDGHLAPAVLAAAGGRGMPPPAGAIPSVSAVMSSP